MFDRPASNHLHLSCRRRQADPHLQCWAGVHGQPPSPRVARDARLAVLKEKNKKNNLILIQPLRYRERKAEENLDHTSWHGR